MAVPTKLSNMQSDLSRNLIDENKRLRLKFKAIDYLRRQRRRESSEGVGKRHRSQSQKVKDL